MTEPGYSGTQAAKIVGITYRQLDYWARTDLIRPSLAEATGSGSRRRYSYRDLLELRVIKTLLDAGIRLESVREVFTYLRQHVTTDIASAHIVISGNQVVLCDGDELVDVLRQGQGVLNVLPLAGVKDDIDAQLVPLADDAAGDAPARRADADMSLERSPLDAVHRALGARMVPFGGWEMPLEYADGHDRRAPRLPRRRRRVRRVAPRHGARRRRRTRSTGCSGALTNDLGKIGPGRAQYTHLLDDADASVLDDIIVWWHPDDGDGDVFDVMPNASNTDRVRDAVGGDETTARAGRARRAGTGGARAPGDGVPRGRRRRSLPRRPRRRGRASPCTVAGTGYTGERGRRDRRPGRRRRRPVGRPSSAPAIAPAGLGARDTLRLEAGLPLHGHELGPGITPLQAGLGWVVAWGKPAFRGRGRAGGRARRPACAATSSASPPRVGGRRAPSCAVLVDGDVVGEVTSGNFSPVLGHGIALGFVPAGDRRRARRSTIDVRGTAAARHGRRRRRSSPSADAATAGRRSPSAGALPSSPVALLRRGLLRRRLLRRRGLLRRRLLGRRPSSAGARREPAPGRAPVRGRRRRPCGAGARRASRPGMRSAEQAAGLLGDLGERRHPPGEVVDDLHELAEVGRQRAQHRRVQRVGQPGRARARPGRSASASRFDSSSAIFTVRVICGSIARIGSSKSLSSRFTRCRRLVEVAPSSR